MYLTEEEEVCSMAWYSLLGQSQAEVSGFACLMMSAHTGAVTAER